LFKKTREEEVYDFNFKVYFAIHIVDGKYAKENNIMPPLDYITQILFFTYTFCMTMRFSQMEECKFRDYSWGITPRRALLSEVRRK